MKLPVKSIGIFVCGAAIASLPYTLSLGKANAQGTTTSSSGTSTTSSAQSSGSKSAQSSSGGTQSAFGSKSAGSNANSGQNAIARSNIEQGVANPPIAAISNDENYIYVAAGDFMYTVRKNDRVVINAQRFPPMQTPARVLQ